MVPRLSTSKDFSSAKKRGDLCSCPQFLHLKNAGIRQVLFHKLGQDSANATLKESPGVLLLAPAKQDPCCALLFPLRTDGGAIEQRTYHVSFESLF